jgi:hypothetical protein
VQVGKLRTAILLATILVATRGPAANLHGSIDAFKYGFVPFHQEFAHYVIRLEAGMVLETSLDETGRFTFPVSTIDPGSIVSWRSTGTNSAFILWPMQQAKLRTLNRVFHFTRREDALVTIKGSVIDGLRMNEISGLANDVDGIEGAFHFGTADSETARHTSWLLYGLFAEITRAGLEVGSSGLQPAQVAFLRTAFRKAAGYANAAALPDRVPCLVHTVNAWAQFAVLAYSYKQRQWPDRDPTDPNLRFARREYRDALQADLAGLQRLLAAPAVAATLATYPRDSVISHLTSAQRDALAESDALQTSDLEAMSLAELTNIISALEAVAGAYQCTE